jgi:hypothetical protein
LKLISNNWQKPSLYREGFYQLSLFSYFK